jgi:hypothetical protein
MKVSAQDHSPAALPPVKNLGSQRRLEGFNSGLMVNHLNAERLIKSSHSEPFKN